MFSLINLCRVGSRIRSSTCARLNDPTCFSAFSLHTTAIQKQENFDMIEPDEVSDPRKSYFSQVTLIGDIAAKPKPLYRDGSVFGYKFKVLSKKRFKTGDGYRLHNHYHNTVCNNKNCFELLEKNVDVDDQVVIRGQLVNVELSSLENNSYMTLIRANTLHKLEN